MTGPKNALAAWSQSALRPVELPSGMKALIKLPDVNLLARSGKIPDELTAVAMKFSTTGIDVAKLQGPEVVEFIRLTYVLIADALEYIAIAESDAWAAFRETGESPTVEGWEPISMTGAELAEQKVDQADLEALGAIIGRTKTPNEVTAVSRFDRGLLTREGALEAITGARPESAPTGDRVSDYAAFRGESTGPDDRPDGEDVRTAAERPDRSRGSRRRAGAGRSGRA